MRRLGEIVGGWQRLGKLVEIGGDWERFGESEGNVETLGDIGGNE